MMTNLHKIILYLNSLPRRHQTRGNCNARKYCRGIKKPTSGNFDFAFLVLIQGLRNGIKNEESINYLTT